MSESSVITGADMEQAAEKLSTPAPETTAVSTPAPTESASAGAEAQPADVDLNAPEWGDIPQQRRPTIAKNIREKAIAAERTKWEQETQQKYGWADQVDRSELDAFRREQAIASSMSPSDYVLNLWQRVQNDPTHGPQLRSQAARILGQRQTQAEEDVMPGPDIPTDASNGKPVVYSAEALAKRDEWFKRQLLKEVASQTAPLREAYQTNQEREQVAALQAQSDAYAARTLDAVGKLRGFKENAATILAKYSALGFTDAQGNWMPDPNDPRNEGEKLRDIYNEVVLPTFEQTATRQAVADITNKAQASTVNPGSQSASEPFDFKKNSWEDGLRHEWARRGGK